MLRLLSRLARRSRPAGTGERGATMVIVAISLTALLGCGALAIDLSSYFKAQKQAQAAADAAALAAAYDLPNNATLAKSDGTQIATTNDPEGSPVVSTPYSGSSGKVKVTVSQTSPSFFGRVFGLTSANISASAVAGGQGTVAQAAIFAYNNGSGCGTGVELGTNNLNIQGGIESNGSLDVSSNSSSSFGTGTYGTGCSYTHTGNPTWTTAPYASPPQAWPIDYRNYSPVKDGAAGCTTVYSGNVTVSATITVGSTNQVICDLTGTLTITGSMAYGTGNPCATNSSATDCAGVTFEAANIIVNGSGETLSAPKVSGSYGLLFYQSGTSNLQQSANNSTLNGTIFAPNAEILISGNSSGTGFLEGNTVVFGGSNNGGSSGSSGNGFTITGDGPPVASNGYALLQ